MVGRLLSFKPLVFIGLISYSLYLWHWPILAFYAPLTRIASHLAPGYDLIMAAFVLSMLAAMLLSWWFVEKPFQKPALDVRKNRYFPMSGAVIGVFGSPWGWLIHLKLKGLSRTSCPRSYA